MKRKFVCVYQCSCEQCYVEFEPMKWVLCHKFKIRPNYTVSGPVSSEKFWVVTCLDSYRMILKFVLQAWCAAIVWAGLF